MLEGVLEKRGKRGHNRQHVGMQKREGEGIGKSKKVKKTHNTPTLAQGGRSRAGRQQHTPHALPPQAQAQASGSGKARQHAAAGLGAGASSAGLLGAVQ